MGCFPIKNLKKKTFKAIKNLVHTLEMNKIVIIMPKMYNSLLFKFSSFRLKEAFNFHDLVFKEHSPNNFN